MFRYLPLAEPSRANPATVRVQYSRFSCHRPQPALDLKPIDPALLAMVEAKRRARDLVAAALEYLSGFDTHADTLRALARYIVERMK